MKIYDGIDQFPRLDFAVVTSGTFDGVHFGHQKILSRVKEIARNAKGETVLLTFWPHPRLVLFPDNHNLKLLTTFEEKAALLEKFGIDHLVKIPFTNEFSKLTSKEFVLNYLVKKINTKKLVIGYDHRFGRNREGSFEYLAANASNYGFAVEEIPKQDIDHVAVSSTKIRNALAEGDILHANNYLGRPYALAGTVVKGEQIGRTLGFPTANIKITEPLKLIPGDGAYAVNILLAAGKYNGMMNIGVRPTVNGKQRTIEVNIFNFKDDIYDQEVAIEIVAQIRKEIKFESLNALKKQLQADKSQALILLQSKS